MTYVSWNRFSPDFSTATFDLKKGGSETFYIANYTIYPKFQSLTRKTQLKRASQRNVPGLLLRPSRKHKH